MGNCAQAGSIPPQHADIIAMLRTYAANAPETLREHLDNSLDDYETSGAWQSDVSDTNGL